MWLYILLGVTGDSEVSLSLTTCFEEKFHINHMNWTKFHPICKCASSTPEKWLPNPTGGIHSSKKTRDQLLGKCFVCCLAHQAQGIGERQECNHGFRPFGSVVCGLLELGTDARSTQAHGGSSANKPQSHKRGHGIGIRASRVSDPFLKVNVYVSANSSGGLKRQS